MEENKNENRMSKILLSSLFVTIVAAITYFWGMVYWHSFAETLGLDIGFYQFTPYAVMYAAWQQVLIFSVVLLALVAVWVIMDAFVPIIALPFDWVLYRLGSWFISRPKRQRDPYWQNNLEKSERHFQDNDGHGLFVLGVASVCLLAFVSVSKLAAEGGSKEARKILESNNATQVRVHWGKEGSVLEGNLVKALGDRIVVRTDRTNSGGDISQQEPDLGPSYLMLDRSECKRIELQVMKRESRLEKTVCDCQTRDEAVSAEK
ncbi:hypothetical protein [Pelagicoccus sp. SDUM812002]|uniref:hypothetical protein n=1 Tax=Pelagicoccus sp. SDUM812002 TaxID=3041266 RepID=UPI00280F47A6|nr:hypothetical protein [Pelagicoccus sp. SDUM812002]MDQ8187789.1 hypothetical protein [Pelagicoccus sp. SDUM812002]